MVLVLAGCSTTVTGTPAPAASALKLLLTDAEISAAVGNTLSTFGFKPYVGGADILPDGYRTDAEATPIACAAITDTAPRIVYEPLPVVEAARQSYFNWDEGVDSSGADLAAVRLATASAAARDFAAFAQTWKQCSGTTVVKHLRGVANTAADSGNGTVIDAEISDVVVDGPLLSATVRTRQRPGGAVSRYERVVGLRDANLVEVSLSISAKGERLPDPRRPAIRVARAVLDKAGPAR